MVNKIIKKHNDLIAKSINQLEDLRNLFFSLNLSNQDDGTKIIQSDINKCIEYAKYYLNDESLYNPNTFRFDSTLINFTDTIKFNNSYISIEKSKNKICEELINCAKELITLNNELRVD